MKAIDKIRKIPIANMAIFFGAGISKEPPSSLPIGRDLLKKVLRLIDVDKKYGTQIINSIIHKPTSMERIFSAMNEAFDNNVKKIYSCLNHKEPGDPRTFNKNHIYLCDLAKNGASLITTNQDLFIEDASKKLTTLNSIILKKHIRKDWNYLKLHGSLRITEISCCSFRKNKCSFSLEKKASG